MKKLILLFLPLTIATAGLLAAQDAAPVAGRATGPKTPPNKAPLPPPLKENIQINLKTELVEGSPINVTITGCGPQFTSQVFITPAGGDNSSSLGPTIANTAVVVTPADAGYKVDLDVECRVPTPVTPTASGAKAGAMAVRYVAQSIKSSLTVKLDTPTTATGDNGKTATITITKPAAK